MKPVAIQLYTLRNIIDKNNFAAIINKLAEFGYQGVESAGLPEGVTTEYFAETLKNAGMKAPSIHANVRTKDYIADSIENALILGISRLVCGFSRQELNTMDGIKHVMNMVYEAVIKAKSYGITVGLHNHYWEFEKINNKYVIDIMFNLCPEVFSELDIYWSESVGGDTIGFMQKNQARVPLLHVKDGWIRNSENEAISFTGSGDNKTPNSNEVGEKIADGSYMYEFRALGEGKFDLKGILSHANYDELEWLIYEQDLSDDPLKDAQTSIAYLKSLQ